MQFNRKTIIISFIILLFACLAYFLFIRKETVKFEKATWLANTVDRFYMADDIIESRLLIGKDTNQVKQILGDLSASEKGLSEWWYYMGAVPAGFGVSMHQLIVRFDINMKVVDVEHASTKQ